jgi:hypothetical protein
MYLDVDEEDRFPRMRPMSRLGFNTEEVRRKTMLHLSWILTAIDFVAMEQRESL